MQFQPPDLQWLKELRDRFSVRLRDYGGPGWGILDWSEERNVGCGDVGVFMRHERDDDIVPSLSLYLAENSHRGGRARCNARFGARS